MPSKISLDLRSQRTTLRAINRSTRKNQEKSNVTKETDKNKDNGELKEVYEFEKPVEIEEVYERPVEIEEVYEKPVEIEIVHTKKRFVKKVKKRRISLKKVRHIKYLKKKLEMKRINEIKC